MRSRFLLFLILIPFFSFGSMQRATAQSQAEMTEQAYADFEKADKELNQVYQKVLKAMSDDIARQKLVAAQKAWITFRDAEAEVDADLARGGTLAPQLRAMSETETTNARIAELKKILAQQ